MCLNGMICIATQISSYEKLVVISNSNSSYEKSPNYLALYLFIKSLILDHFPCVNRLHIYKLIIGHSIIRYIHIFFQNKHSHNLKSCYLER